MSACGLQTSLSKQPIDLSRAWQRTLGAVKHAVEHRLATSRVNVMQLHGSAGFLL